MDTKDIRSFRLVYEERSINRAAKQLFITPQGLSRIIHKLEEELQIVLFERTKGGMVPTECGDYFYAQSQELLYQLEDMKYRLQKMNSRQRKIKIGFACGVLNLVSLKKLNTIQKEMPDVLVQWEELENQEVAEQVNRGLLDIGFIIGAVPGNEIESQVVYEGKMNVLVYPGHPFYGKEKLSIEELKEQPLISLNQSISVIIVLCSVVVTLDLCRISLSIRWKASSYTAFAMKNWDLESMQIFIKRTGYIRIFEELNCRMPYRGKCI